VEGLGEGAADAGGAACNKDSVAGGLHAVSLKLGGRECSSGLDCAVRVRSHFSPVA
jgi:hypothetical protein